ncbi:hypothetical protein [Streptomyces filamentosus]|uniref:hypothetical protein n=1 Tax=Streptomyces filamentosus TaxID=67294 RepID=UPI00123BC5FA|nr:hypothetical protein [Streptomyces filamentosus]KAA6219055.1 hypothetical protein CP979_20845 [Streptomyces filamentosus]
MKIRRTLATAVAVAVTTPVVFLSAGPAFAETPKPRTDASAQDVKDGPEDDDFAEYEKLIEAVVAAEEKLEALKEERAALAEDLRAGNVGEAVKTEYAAAKLAYDEAKAAREAAATTLAEAQAELDALNADPEATAEDKAAAEQAVAEAKAKADEAVAAEAAAKLRHDAADTAFSDARVALARRISLLDPKIVLAEQELADAEAALEAYENEGSCVEDDSVRSTLTGPKTITIGSSADFSLTVRNTSDRDLDSVRSYVFAAHLPESWDDILDEEDPGLERYFSIDWKSAANPEWTELDFQDEAVELGRIAKGGKAEVTLRLTVDEDAPAGKGITFSTGEYENEDGSCGISQQYAKAEFDVVEPTEEPSEEPTDEPTAEPSPSTTTPTPAPTATATGGNTQTTQQGGSSATAVRTGGELAATGSNDALPKIGAAAGAALVLGAVALFTARRRRANA